MPKCDDLAFEAVTFTHELCRVVTVHDELATDGHQQSNHEAIEQRITRLVKLEFVNGPDHVVAQQPVEQKMEDHKRVTCVLIHVRSVGPVDVHYRWPAPSHEGAKRAQAEHAGTHSNAHCGKLIPELDLVGIGRIPRDVGDGDVCARETRPISDRLVVVSSSGGEIGAGQERSSGESADYSANDRKRWVHAGRLP